MQHDTIHHDRRRAIGALGLGLLIGGPAWTQEPVSSSRAIRLLIGYPPGGGADVLGRILAVRLSQTLAQPIVIDNRPGAGGTLAAGVLANSPADGSTLYMAESAILVAPAIYAKIGYDPATLTPVGSIGNLAYCAVVHPSFPAKNIAELIEVLKASPGKYSYASPGVGNIAHLSAEMFKRAAGVEMVHVPYKGGTPALADLVGGQIPICFVSLPPALALAKAGRLRLLGVTTSKRSEVAKDVPAIAETLPGFNAATSIFMLAPPNTPAQVVARLNSAIHTVMAMPDVQKDFTAQGAGLQTGSPQELSAQIRTELKTWETVARAAGARAD